MGTKHTPEAYEIGGESVDTYRNPEETAGKVLGLVRQYNVLDQEQISGFFPGEEKAAAKAVRKLLKNRQIYKNPYTGLIASSEFAYSLKDEGTIKSLWVLVDMLKKRPVEGHYLAAKEDFPVRILFFSSEEIYDILYVGAGDVKLVNGMFGKSRRPGENHIIAVEDRAVIGQMEVPGVIGYCVVKEGGGIEYYRRRP